MRLREMCRVYDTGVGVDASRSVFATCACSAVRSLSIRS